MDGPEGSTKATLWCGWNDMSSIVNIYIKETWKGALHGSGKAAGMIVYIDGKGMEHRKIETTQVKDSTKNRLHLQIITKVLHALKCPCSVGIYMDGVGNIRGCISQGLPEQWKKAGWQNKRGQGIKNADIWKLLTPLLNRHEVGIIGYLDTYDRELEEALKEE